MITTFYIVYIQILCVIVYVVLIHKTDLDLGLVPQMCPCIQLCFWSTEFFI